MTVATDFAAFRRNVRSTPGEEVVLWEGEVIAAPASFSSKVRVRARRSATGEAYELGEAAWPKPTGKQLPAAGDLCLVALDETNTPTIIGWSVPWGSGDVRTSHSFMLRGEVTAGAVPRHHISLSANETQQLVKLRYEIESGTAVKFKITHNGVDIPGCGTTGEPLSATSASKTTLPTNPVELAEDDYLKLVIITTEGKPEGLSVTLMIDHSP